MFAFWPFDFSCGGFACILFFVVWIIGLSIGQVFKDVTNVAKKVAQNETVQEAGKGILAAWLESMFR